MKKIFILILMCSPSVFAQGLKYATYFGGSQSDIAHGIVLGSFNDMYIAGQASSPDFPVLNAYQPKLAGQVNAFVAKFNANGRLGWSTYLGGSGQDRATGVATDKTKNVYVTGTTNSADFPITQGVVQPQMAGPGSNAFVAKFNSFGKLIWSTYLGLSGTQGNTIAVDSKGNVFVAGNTMGAASVDAYVTELNSSGTAILYSATLGGSGTDSIQSIALLGDEIYAAGYTNSTNFPVTPGAVQLSCGTACSDYYTGFVAKLGASGVSYATYLGGTETTVPGTTFNVGIGVAVDSAGNAYITGTTNTTDFPVTSNAYQKIYGGTTDLPGGVAGCLDFLNGMFPCGDAYVVKLNPTGTTIVWGTYLGGSTADIGYAIKLDATGNVWVGGYTQSYSCPTCDPIHYPFPTTQNAYQPVKGGGLDSFLSELSPDGTTLIYSTYYGGSDDEIDFGLAVDSVGNGYLAGRTISTDTPMTANAFQKTLKGTINGFIAKIAP
jgi:large repetitive protein